MIDPMRAQTTARWQHAFRKAIKSNGAAQVERLMYGCYQVPSATTPGHTYSIVGVAADGRDHRCDCPAGLAGQPCYHVASVVLRRTQETALKQWRAMQAKRVEHSVLVPGATATRQQSVRRVEL